MQMQLKIKVIALSQMDTSYLNKPANTDPDIVI